MGTSRTLEGDTMILRHYKAPRHDPRRDSSYLRWLRILPCIVCCQWNLPTNRRSGPVEAAHVGKRGIGQKCADSEALPLCVWHHRTGPQAHHVLGKKFWQFWKLDRFSLIADHQRRFEEKEKNAA